MMDRYIIKTPRASNAAFGKKPEQRLRQSTIESLKGVVVVEDVLRHKAILKLADQSKENILKSLHELDSKIPSRKVLKDTKIGHTINRLSKHESKEVSDLAKIIIKKWSEFFEEKKDKPMIEVKCDRQTEGMRNTARKHLAGALGITEKKDLVESIEREVFHQHGRLINHSYRRSMRSIVFTLKHQEDVRNKVLNKNMEITDLVTMYKKEIKKS